MKQIIIITILVLLFLFVQVNTFTQTLFNDGYIPVDYQENWYKAGLLRDMSSVEPKLVIVITPGDASSQVSNAIQLARNHVNYMHGLAIIYFGEGTFDFTNSIPLVPNDSNIVFQGAGSDKTFLNFKNMENSNCFDIYGSAPSWGPLSDLSQDFNKGDSVLHAFPFSGLSSLSPGDWVHFVKYNYDYHTPNPPLIKDIIGQITQIEAKGPEASGDWAEIKDVANRNYIDSFYSPTSLKIRKITPVKNIGIEDLTIVREPDEEASVYAYNIRFNCAINCWVKGVNSFKPSRSHMSITRSSHIEISGCYFHEAMGYGNGGWGYGVVLEASTTNCLVENNIFKKLRHALVAVAGSNCNVWTFNYSRDQHSTGIPSTDRDLDLHAKYPFGHLFEHNVVEKIASDNHHGDNGPYNAFFRNYSYAGNIQLETMWDWSTLGNIYDDDPLEAVWQLYEHDPVVDIFGFYNGLSYHHNWFKFNSFEDDAFLYDVSYYYSSRPDFLASNYTWPSIGPRKTYQDLTQSIPAKARYNASKKTYLPDPTPKPPTYSGTLPYNQTWSGTHTLTGDITIPSGMTLTIEPGTIVFTPANKKITVQGALVAEGTSSEPITFDKSGSSNWYGIKFEDSSDDDECVLKYCTIQNASYGAYCYKASPDIKNCTINNNFFGIFASYGTVDHEIFYNDIVNNTYGVGIVNKDMITFRENDVHENSTLNLYCSNVLDYPIFQDNSIYGCSGGNGVNLYGSVPQFIGNVIFDNYGYGIYM